MSSRRRLCGGVTLSAGSHHNGFTEHQRSELSADQSPSVTAAAAAAAALSQNDTPQQPLGTASTDVSRQFKQFIPKVGLFFLLAFVNTILDSLKDTLVITAHGGGTQVIPYLTVYAVLPSSILFLFLYSFATQRLARGQLFSIIVTAFVSFFVTFAMVLYPNHEALHLHALADSMSQVLPAGLDGLVGMLRNWTFTAFFCAAELWGDVCLGLLFWGLANDTTSLADASTLYPMFGLGANVAQALAGFVLKAYSGSSTNSFASELQSLMLIVVGFAAMAIALHHYIEHTEAKPAAGTSLLSQLTTQLAPSGSHSSSQESSLQGFAISSSSSSSSSAESSTSSSTHSTPHPTLNGRSGSTHTLPSVLFTQTHLNGAHPGSLSASGSIPPSHTGSLSAQPVLDSHSPSFSHSALESSIAQQQHLSSTQHSGSSAEHTGSSSSSSEQPTQATDSAASGSEQQGEEKKADLGEIYRVLSQSTPIRCLAVMSIAQGLCTNLMEFAWKSHMRLLYTTPGEFTSFLGDVSTWQGVVTGILMVMSPALFERMGWKGVAAATPQVLLWGGGVFFASCIGYQLLSASAVSAGGLIAGSSALNALVMGGALLYVFGKSAKFSLFKPAEEMVYISLDSEGRTKGKAAIDVVGAQAGKSAGSVLQQLLLVISGGAIAGSLPIMAIVYIAMAKGWLRSVSLLALQNNYGHADSVHKDHPHQAQAPPGATIAEGTYTSDDEGAGELDVMSHSWKAKAQGGAALAGSAGAALDGVAAGSNGVGASNGAVGLGLGLNAGMSGSGTTGVDGGAGGSRAEANGAYLSHRREGPGRQVEMGVNGLHAQDGSSSSSRNSTVAVAPRFGLSVNGTSFFSVTRAHADLGEPRLHAAANGSSVDGTGSSTVSSGHLPDTHTHTTPAVRL
ncbi:MAG: hypothetical protein WDW38_008205 [Sanguina aurantia]